MHHLDIVDQADSSRLEGRINSLNKSSTYLQSNALEDTQMLPSFCLKNLPKCSSFQLET